MTEKTPVKEYWLSIGISDAGVYDFWSVLLTNIVEVGEVRLETSWGDFKAVVTRVILLKQAVYDDFDDPVYLVYYYRTYFDQQDHMVRTEAFLEDTSKMAMLADPTLRSLLRQADEPLSRYEALEYSKTLKLKGRK